MYHVAIDLGGRESQICVRKDDTEIVEEARLPTQLLGLQFKDMAPSRILLETCSEAFAIADLAKQAGHEVRVVPATLVRSLGVGARGIKTDKRDARALSEASCRILLPSVHVRSKQSRERQSLLGMRTVLVEARTKLINCVRGWMRSELIRLKSGSTETFSARLRQHFVTQANTTPSFVDRQLKVIDELSVQIRAADKEVETLAKSDECCKRLMSLPYIGTTTSLCFSTVVDDVRRFKNASAVESYLGITPGERSSSQRVQRTAITKAGPAEVRRLLDQCCWSMYRGKPNDPLVLWAKQVADRRGKKVAIVAMMRKVTGILFAMMRDGTTYQPTRASTICSAATATG